MNDAAVIATGVSVDATEAGVHTTDLSVAGSGAPVALTGAGVIATEAGVASTDPDVDVAEDPLVRNESCDRWTDCGGVPAPMSSDSVRWVAPDGCLSIVRAPAKNGPPRLAAAPRSIPQEPERRHRAVLRSHTESLRVRQDMGWMSCS